VTAEDLHPEQLGVKTAFLHGDIYMVRHRDISYWIRSI